MKSKVILCICFILSLFTLVGCGGSSEHAYQDAIKESLVDGDKSIETSAEMEAYLFSPDYNPWKVVDKQRGQFQERLIKLLAKGGFNQGLSVYDAYYKFEYDHYNREYICEITVYCKIDNVDRTIVIDCGVARVTGKDLVLSNNWYVRLYSNYPKVEITNVRWAHCYYRDGEIDKKFRQSYIMFASPNKFIMDNGIYIQRFGY